MTRLTRRVAPGLNVVDSTTLVDAKTGVVYGSSGVSVLVRQTDAVTVASAVTETTAFTYSDPGNQLGTSGVFRLTLMGTVTDSALDTATSFSIRFKYGGTTVATVAVTTDDAATTIGTGRSFRLVFDLFAAGSASSLIGAVSGVMPLLAAPTRQPISAQSAAFVEDSSQPQDLVVVFFWNAAQAAASATLHAAILELF